jgi:hypothetical protein
MLLLSHSFADTRHSSKPAQQIPEAAATEVNHCADIRLGDVFNLKFHGDSSFSNLFTGDYNLKTRFLSQSQVEFYSDWGDNLRYLVDFNNPKGPLAITEKSKDGGVERTVYCNEYPIGENPDGLRKNKNVSGRQECKAFLKHIKEYLYLAHKNYTGGSKSNEAKLEAKPAAVEDELGKRSIECAIKGFYERFNSKLGDLVK